MDAFCALPDGHAGQHAGTHTDPRGWRLQVNPFSEVVAIGPRLRPGEKMVGVIEVVEPDHDERAEEHPARRYTGRTLASVSFRIYGAPGFKGTVLAEGDHLMTEEVAVALDAERPHWGPWQPDQATVKAVVEALDEERDRYLIPHRLANEPTQDQRIRAATVDALTTMLAERFNLTEGRDDG